MLVNSGRVEYITEEGDKSLYWNIPIANTTTILLGTGTSITQAAMRELAKAGVLVGFCGGGGTPLFCANEVDFEVSWFSPQSEYRPTEYLQQWARFWFDDQKRLDAAKELQLARIRMLKKQWQNNKQYKEDGFYVNPIDLDVELEKFQRNLAQAKDTTQVLTSEAQLTKKLYKFAAQAMNYADFTRSKRAQSIDPANRLLDHGNYLAYGLGATATWVLGLPHGLAILHGKTRRGGLVFDAADLIKDALILPQAFISAVRGDEEQEFRQACIQNLLDNEALDFIIDTLKDIALKIGSLE